MHRLFCSGPDCSAPLSNLIIPPGVITIELINASTSQQPDAGGQSLLGLVGGVAMAESVI